MVLTAKQKATRVAALLATAYALNVGVGGLNAVRKADISAEKKEFSTVRTEVTAFVDKLKERGMPAGLMGAYAHGATARLAPDQAIIIDTKDSGFRSLENYMLNHPNILSTNELTKLDSLNKRYWEVESQTRKIQKEAYKRGVLKHATFGLAVKGKKRSVMKHGRR